MSFTDKITSAKVVIGDINTNAGEKLVSELPGSKFVQCDTTEWEDQVHLFKQAAQFSTSGRISYVIANAGITKADQTFSFDGKAIYCSLDLISSSLSFRA
jgi:NAD(P)-dependent dehydrogenase (short-subunit alcohol dehydrogenase family)